MGVVACTPVFLPTRDKEDLCFKGACEREGVSAGRGPGGAARGRGAEAGDLAALRQGGIGRDGLTQR